MIKKAIWKENIKANVALNYLFHAITPDQLSQIDALLDEHWTLSLAKDAYDSSRAAGVLAICGSTFLDITAYLPEMVDPVLGRALSVAIAYSVGQQALQYLMPTFITPQAALNETELPTIYTVSPDVPALIARLTAINADLKAALKQDERKTWLDAAGTFIGAFAGGSMDSEAAKSGGPATLGFGVAGAYVVSFFRGHEMGGAGVPTHWRDVLENDQRRHEAPPSAAAP